MLEEAEPSFVPAGALEASVLLPKLEEHSEFDVGLHNSFLGESSYAGPAESTFQVDTSVTATNTDLSRMSSMDEKRSIKEKVRASIARARGEQDEEDYDTYLQRNETIRQSIAVTDILLSGRLPFLVNSVGTSADSNNKSPQRSGRLSKVSGPPNNAKGKLQRLHSSSQSVGDVSLSSSQQSYHSTPTTASALTKHSSHKPSASPGISRAVSQDMQSLASSPSQTPIITRASSTKLPAVTSSKTATNTTTLPRKPADLAETLLYGEKFGTQGGLIDGLVPGGTVSSSKFHSLMSNFTKSLPTHANKTADGKLQYVLQQLNKVKNDLNPSEIYFEAGMIFYEMNVYERAVVCLEKATIQSNAAEIIDTLVLPNDIHYQRKIERMSPFMLPKFLEDRKATRNNLIFQESEKQRLRAQAAHCELCRIRCLVPQVRDLWKAHGHVQAAFALCDGNEEQYQCLLFFHRLLVAFTVDVLQAETEFQRDQQIVRGSAGPMSDAHLTVLLQLQHFEPQNVSYQDWLGRRFTEKCMFEEATFHYEQARELRRYKPSRQEVLQLWRKKPQASEEQAIAMAEMIRKNVHKTPIQSYQNFEGTIYDVAARDALKDLSRFPGKHDDMCTVIYLPPPQGWTGQK